MKLQGRNLEPNLRGEDVKLLQSELRRLKLKTQIVDQEGLFGSTTFLAVQEFQRSHGLEATGIVDEQTARLINKEVDEIGPEQFIVRGEVRQADGDPLRAHIVRVFRKGLRRDDLLGQATNAATGSYSVEYQPAERPFSIAVRAGDKGISDGWQRGTRQHDRKFRVAAAVVVAIVARRPTGELGVQSRLLSIRLLRAQTREGGPGAMIRAVAHSLPNQLWSHTRKEK